MENEELEQKERTTVLEYSSIPSLARVLVTIIFHARKKRLSAGKKR